MYVARTAITTFSLIKEKMGVRFPPAQFNTEKWRNGRRGCYEKYIMFRGINSEYFMLGASFIDGSNPSFSVVGR